MLQAVELFGSHSAIHVHKFSLNIRHSINLQDNVK